MGIEKTLQIWDWVESVSGWGWDISSKSVQYNQKRAGATESWSEIQLLRYSLSQLGNWNTKRERDAINSFEAQTFGWGEYWKSDDKHRVFYRQTFFAWELPNLRTSQHQERSEDKVAQFQAACNEIRHYPVRPHSIREKKHISLKNWSFDAFGRHPAWICCRR